jgi:hypothetical protein
MRILILVFLTSVSSCFGQADNALARVRALSLPMLKGDVPALYSPAAKTRAELYRSTLEAAHTWYETQLGIAVPVTLAVLDKPDWGQATPVPYPMPNSKPGLVTLPSRMEDFPGFAEMKVDADVLAQVISIHELGHLVADKEGIGARNPWINEMVANIFVAEYLAAHRPDLKPPAARDLPSPRYTSLADLDYLRFDGVSFSNYAWFQFQLNRLSSFVAQKRDLRPVVEQLKIAFPAETSGYLPLPEVLRRMEVVAAGFTGTLGLLSRPATITKIRESACSDAATREGASTFLVVDNRTASEIGVSQSGKDPIRVPAGRWQRLAVGVGEQVSLSNGTCLMTLNEPALAVIGKD